MLKNRKYREYYMILFTEQEPRRMLTNRKDREDYMMLLTEQEAYGNAR
jgi:hypothetical protein